MNIKVAAFTVSEKSINTVMFGLSIIYKLSHDKTAKAACAQSEGSDQHGCPPSLI